MSRPHINFIRNLYRELKLSEAKATDNDYYKQKINRLRNDLKLARRFQKPVVPLAGKEMEYTVYYAEYDIFDNIEVVGKDFIWQMYRDSPELIWRTAFLNERLFKVPNGFYSALTDNHFYIPSDKGHVRGMQQAGWRQISSAGCLMDDDLDVSQPLYIACDSNAAISTLCVAQVDHVRHEMKTIKSFFVKTPGKLQDVVKQFCEYYRPMLRKEVVFYYDHTFTWTTGTTDDSYADVIIKTLTANRYQVTDVYIGQSPGHGWKHLQIDLALKGDTQFYFPRFNEMNNEFLKIAMEQTGIRQGNNGFEKDKSPEKLPDTPDSRDEHKTHVTDAWDTLFVGINFYFRSPFNEYNATLFLGRQ